MGYFGALTLFFSALLKLQKCINWDSGLTRRAVSMEGCKGQIFIKGHRRFCHFLCVLFGISI